MIAISDRGTPKGFRHMHGFGRHTFLDDQNERVRAKFRGDESIRVCMDPEYLSKASSSATVVT
jgi:catalase